MCGLAVGVIFNPCFWWLVLEMLVFCTACGGFCGFWAVWFLLLVLCCHLERFKRALNGFYMVATIKYLILCRLSILKAFKSV